MKKVLFILASFAFTFFVSTAQAQYKADASKSTLTWVGKKVTGEHTGNIGVKSADLKVSGKKLTGGTIVIDMESITCTDLTDKEWNGKLVGHLKSDDFFSVANHKTATFKITKVDGKNVTGDLTIKGITKSITFPVDVKMSGDMLMAKGTATIDRTKFDIKYGSGNFFEGLGDKMIYDDFTLEFDLTASK